MKREGDRRRILVTEATDRVGGLIQSRHGEPGQWEEGPNTLLPQDPVLRAAVDAGLADELIHSKPRSPRYICWEGRLHGLTSPLDVLKGDLLTWGGKLRALRGFLGLRPDKPPGKEETLAEFTVRNLGEQVLARLIEPVCTGTFAGDPAKLSAQAAFKKVREQTRLDAN